METKVKMKNPYFTNIDITPVPNFYAPAYIKYENKKVVKPKIKGEKKHGN
jgi:hypothetical protein